MSTNDGGRAFSSTYVYTDRDDVVCSSVEEGMSLRDYFAAKVMQADMCGDPLGGHWTNEAMDNRAKAYFMMADAMLRARESA